MYKKIIQSPKSLSQQDSPRKSLKKASLIFESEGCSRLLNKLLMRRVSFGVCVECGGPLGDGSLSNFCRVCLAPFPIITNIGDPADAWQWRVVQTKPAYAGGAFRAERAGVFERRSIRYIGEFGTFEQAREAAEKSRERSLSASARCWGYA